MKFKDDNLTKVSLFLDPDEAKEMFILGVNSVIDDSDRSGKVICVAADKINSSDKNTCKEVSDDMWEGMILVGIAKKLDFDIKD